MTKHVVSCIVLSIPIWAVPLGRADEPLTIATFNCYWLIESKIQQRHDVSAQSADERAAAFAEKAGLVARAIADLDADVIGLVEVGPERDVQVLRDAVEAEGVDYPHVAVCDSKDSFTRQHVAVFSKRPLRDVVREITGRESYDEELDDADTEKDTGVSKGMRVTFTAAGRDVHLYVVHFVSERGGHEADAKRVAQASIVRRHYLDLLRRGQHVVVVGDLNDYRGQPAVRRVRGRDDIFGDLIQTGQTRYFNSSVLGTRWTHEFRGQRRQIDHVLVSRSIKEAATRSNGIRARVVPHAGEAVSDHRPFVVTIRFRDP